jgi:tRNA(Arg) A34 adenosine deaminase TadA
MACYNSSTDGWFIEIESPEIEEVLPERIDCYIIENIDRTICGPLSKDLSAIFPLRCPASASGKSSTESSTSSATQFPRTDHLKRTRRRAATENELKLRTNTQTHQVSSSSSSDDKTPCSKLESGDVDSGDIDIHDDTEKQSNCQNSKKRKQKENSNQTSIPWSLDVLVGSVQHINDSLNTANTTKNAPSPLLAILAKYGLSEQSPNFTCQSLPGRPAKNKQERDEWNKSLWPTLFFEKKTTQYKQEEIALTSAEVDLMKNGMQEALADAVVANKQLIEWKEQLKDKELLLSISGAVVTDPQTGSIVSRASQERKLQGMAGDVATNHQIWASFPDYVNPLSTAPLLAIQGVSRIERQVAISNGMESDEFRGGQYLCTGYDVYLTKEPNIFEAMSLVHSRVRRVIFGIPDEGMGGLGGPKSSSQHAGIHSLPGTNHHYRAFRLNLSDASDGCKVDDVTRKSLVAELQNLHPEKADC